MLTGLLSSRSLTRFRSRSVALQYSSSTSWPSGISSGAAKPSYKDQIGAVLYKLPTLFKVENKGKCSTSHVQKCSPPKFFHSPKLSIGQKYLSKISNQTWSLKSDKWFRWNPANRLTGQMTENMFFFSDSRVLETLDYQLEWSDMYSRLCCHRQLKLRTSILVITTSIVTGQERKMFTPPLPENVKVYVSKGGVSTGQKSIYHIPSALNTSSI